MFSKSVTLVLILAVISLTGCATTKVERVERDKKIDLSGDWNDYDAMLVSEEMLKDCLSKPWLFHFAEEKGRAPVVIVGHVANKTDEHINAQIFVKYLERELLNSGKVVFVANPMEREDLRQEREDQKGFTSPETIAQVAKEHGADYMLIGSVNSLRDEVRGKSVNYYQVNLELVDLSTNVKVWIGSKDIKKYIKNPRVSL
jgi:penicillin-binding protein activator